jgi:hypothetical protein
MIPNEIEDSKLYVTKDIALAATLMNLKFLMLGIDYQIEGVKNLPVGYFKFELTENLQAAIVKYIQSLLMVEPKLFMSNIKTLKSEVQSMLDNPRR